MKYRIGILTYHTGFNYGASLQAYALQKNILKMGFSCEIINFETEAFVASREMFSRHPKRIKEFIKILSRIPYYSSLKKRQKLFDEFTKGCLKLSSLYRTEKEMIDSIGDYDCIVCGSDQIWNLSESAGPAANLVFFLNFPKRQRRVSYAASFGKWVKEASSREDEFITWLKQFDAISVREISGKEYLKSRNIKCELAIDPTVLLDRVDYDVICAPRIIKHPYVLLFSWLCGNEVIASAKKISRELDLPIYNIVPPPRGMGKAIKRKLDIGPKEFLSMVKYADFIVTDSFHGTVFSTIYEKPYVSVVTNGKADPRMESILQQLGLEEHLVNCKNIDLRSLKQTNYKTVRDKKKRLCEASLAFLHKALSVEEL